MMRNTNQNLFKYSFITMNIFHRPFFGFVIVSFMLCVHAPTFAFIIPVSQEQSSFTSMIRLLAVNHVDNNQDDPIDHFLSSSHEDNNNGDNNNGYNDKDSQAAAAWDGHDAIDAGVETAAEERALMMAQELVQKILLQQKNNEPSSKPAGSSSSSVITYDEVHLAHDLDHVHMETNAELHEAEELAVWDGHDGLDAGMETAAEERAVMLAAEMIARHKKQQQKTKHTNDDDDDDHHDKKEESSASRKLVP